MSLGIRSVEAGVDSAVRVPVRWPLDQVKAAGGPVSFGIKLARGAVLGAWHCILVGPQGEAIFAQDEVLGRWEDGSVRWLLLDAVVPAGSEVSGDWEVLVL